MRYIVVDLEATCWKSGTRPERMEIIEIGAVELASAQGPARSEFSCFVRPIDEPILSEFCTHLTGIQQSDVEGATTFPDALAAFVGWIGPEPFVLCSWGAYDLGQFRTDCRRHGIPQPANFEQHVNLKRAFAELHGIPPCGMKAALARLELPFAGRHHRGIDDARNIARIATVILPRIEAEDARA